MNGGHGVLISWLKTIIHITNNVASFQERPYQDDSITSRPLSEVKHLRVRLVLRWGTTLESLMLFFSLLFLLHCQRVPWYELSSMVP